MSGHLFSAPPTAETLEDMQCTTADGSVRPRDSVCHASLRPHASPAVSSRGASTTVRDTSSGCTRNGFLAQSTTRATLPQTRHLVRSRLVFAMASALYAVALISWAPRDLSAALSKVLTGLLSDQVSALPMQ